MTAIHIPHRAGLPYGLGRHIEHDPRSLAYAHGVLPRTAITAVDWTRRIPILDQGDLGSCTGNAATGLLGTDCASRTGATEATITAAAAAASCGIFDAGTYPLDETFAVQLYELATLLDDVPGAYPPQDTGSSGLGVAKALVALGLAERYTHAFSMAALNSALQAGPVLVGTIWLESMFEPTAGGRIFVDRRSPAAGGHEYEISGYNPNTDRYKIPMSWGIGFGADGWAWIGAADMAWLLSQQGDVTIPALATTPTPTPVPTPARPDAADQTLIGAFATWQTARAKA